MEYVIHCKGRYSIFDVARIRAYPISTRTNKVKLLDLLSPQEALAGTYRISDESQSCLSQLADFIVSTAEGGKPVILFAGAHLIKNGLERVRLTFVGNVDTASLPGSGFLAA